MEHNTAMETTSAQDLNILDSADDDCIGHILRHLYMNDLLSATKRSRRFLECAFADKWLFRSVAVEDIHSIRCPPSSREVVSLHNAPELLRMFGSLIKSFEYRVFGCSDEKAERGDKMLELLGKYCGKTLKKLKITAYEPNFIQKNQFPALEELVLICAEPINFCLDAPIKHLEIEAFSLINNPWFIREFPHLESVRLRGMGITKVFLNKFLALNRQLRALEIYAAYIMPNDIDAIVKQLIVPANTVERNGKWLKITFG